MTAERKTGRRGLSEADIARFVSVPHSNVSVRAFGDRNPAEPRLITVFARRNTFPDEERPFGLTLERLVIADVDAMSPLYHKGVRPGWRILG